MADTITARIRTHSTDYIGDGNPLDTRWESFTHDWPNNPNTGQPWTWDEINALEIGVALHGDELTPMCSQIYVEVTYTPAAGIARPLIGGSLAGNSLVGKGLARCI